MMMIAAVLAAIVMHAAAAEAGAAPLAGRVALVSGTFVYGVWTPRVPAHNELTGIHAIWCTISRNACPPRDLA